MILQKEDRDICLIEGVKQKDVPGGASFLFMC